MAKSLKYSPEDIQGFLNYAKEKNISILKMMKELKINRRTFYMTAHRYGMNTDGVRQAEPFNTRAMTKEQVEEVLKTAEAKRISHKNACAEFGYSYNTFRGAIVRYHVKADRFSSTYSKEDVVKTFEYAKANHVSLAKACEHFNYKYHLLSPSAKRYGLKLEREVTIYEEAKALPDKEFVQFYLEKGYVANEIFHVYQKLGRKIARGMIYYYVAQASEERVKAKIAKLEKKIAELRAEPVL